MHQERTLGTEMYLEMCASYIDIFCSPRLGLRERIVLAAKVSFFFRIWKLWISHGDHSVFGNTRKITSTDCFVSQQCFLDIQMSCHFVVLLIVHFKTRYLGLAVPLHLTGSDSCEIFFSKIGGMVGLERAYDFNELVNTANTLNHLSGIEYGQNGLAFGRVHNKMKNVWESLHPLQEGEARCDLSDYSQVSTDADVISALKEGLKEAQSVIRILNMAPSTVAKKKDWFLTPWVVEKADFKSFAHVPQRNPVAGEDGDVEVLAHEADELTARLDGDGDESLAEYDTLAEEGEFDDGLDPLVVAESEARHCLGDMLNSISGEVSITPPPKKIVPVVEFGGCNIYKSTLVAQLNGNPFLSKDRLTRVRNSIYFNNSEDYLSAAQCSSTCLLGIGSHCGVYFVQRSTTLVSSTVKAAVSRRSKSRLAKGKNPCSVLTGVDEGTWWLGRIQKIKRKYGNKWGNSRQPIDLENRTIRSSNKSNTTQSCQVLLNWYSKTTNSTLKFRYDVADAIWIDADCIISTVTLNYSASTNLYSLDVEDARSFNEFASKHT